MSSKSGRTGLGHRVYRRNRVAVLSQSDVCGICGHPGSMTTDHIVSHKEWIAAGLPPSAFNDVANLQPAHGTMGNTGLVNRCPICNRLCNQSKGSRSIAASGIRPW